MKKSIDVIEILGLLPHRYPIILVDRVLDYEPFDHLTAIKNVTINEPVFNGHFPGNPIMPGVLIIEAMAQASAILYSLSGKPQEGHDFVYFFAGIDKAKFKQVVIPGDTLTLKVKVLAQKKGFWRLQGEAFVDEKLVCSAVLMSIAKEVKRDR